MSGTRLLGGLLTLVVSTLTGCSDAGTEAWEDHRVPIFADAYLHNATDWTIDVELQMLTPEAELDCDNVAVTPELLLAPGVLAPAEEVVLPADATLGLRDMSRTHNCYAALITPLGEPSYAVVWWADSLPEDWVDGEITEESELRWGAVSIVSLTGVLSYRPHGPVGVHEVR